MACVWLWTLCDEHNLKNWTTTTPLQTQLCLYPSWEFLEPLLMTWWRLVCIWIHVSPLKMYSSHCIYIRSHWLPCVLHPIICLKYKSHKSSLPLWNAAPSTHSQPSFNCMRTVQFQINIPKTCRLWPGLRLQDLHVQDELQRVTVPQSM